MIIHGKWIRNFLKILLERFVILIPMNLKNSTQHNISNIAEEWVDLYVWYNVTKLRSASDK